MNKLLYPTFFFFLFTLIISCDKNNEENISSEPTSTKLVFQVESIKGTDVILAKENSIAASTTSNNTTANTSATKLQEFDTNAGITLDTYITQAPIESTENLKRGINDIKNISPIANPNPMSPGKTYRILIYKNNEQKIWQQALATAGQPINIDVPKGDKFTWYAYSYNNTDNIPAPSNEQNPTIEATANKDLLFASGEINIPMSPIGENRVYPIGITFQHKMAQIKVRIDGSLLSKYADIKGLKASFVNDNYIKTGTFNIRGKAMESNFTILPTTELFNTGINPTNIWEQTFLTADANAAASYKIKITDLPVTFTGVDPSIANVNIATFESSTMSLPNLEKTFNFSAPKGGQSLFGTINLSYTLPSKRILHVSTTHDYAYSMQKSDPWKMINDKRNFGNLPESLVRMQPYANGEGVWKGGNATDCGTENFILANTTVAGQVPIINRLKSTDPNLQPDIVIFAHDMYTIHADLQNAIVEYINKGGVFILMYESTSINGKDLISKIFGVSNTTLTMTSLGPAGSMYKIQNINDRVTNGPFGDVRGKHWGEDSSTSVGVNGLPTNDVVVYSYGLPTNHTATGTYASWATIPSMFRHKNKNFYYLGDGGLTSWNTANSYTACPFKYDATTGRPVAKPYGFAWTHVPSGVDYKAGSEGAYNSYIAGNLMLWAAELAEFKGIKKWRYKPD